MALNLTSVSNSAIACVDNSSINLFKLNFLYAAKAFNRLCLSSGRRTVEVDILNPSQILFRR